MHNIPVDINGDDLMKPKNIFLFVMLGIIAGLVVYFRSDIISLTSQPEQFRDFIRSYENLAVPVYLLLSSIRSVFFLPAGVFAIVSGITFGTLLGTVLACIGVTLSGILAFIISGYAGREFIEKLFKNRLLAIENKLKDSGLIYIAILRMIPVFPFDAVSYASGLTNVKFSNFVFGTFIGSLPGAFVYTYLGSSLLDIRSKKFMISLGLVIVISLIPLIYKYVLKKG